MLNTLKNSSDPNADLFFNQAKFFEDDGYFVDLENTITGKLCDIDNTERLKKILVNKIIRNGRKYRYFTVEDRPRFSELLDMLPCVKEELVGNAIDREIQSNKHLKERLREIAKELPVVDVNEPTFNEAERSAVKEIYFGLSSDSRRKMFRIAKHYALYEAIMTEPVLYVRELLNMEKLEALDAIQGDKVELASGGKVDFGRFYDNIFGNVYLSNDSDYYDLSDVKAIIKESVISGEGGDNRLVSQKVVFDEKRSIKEFSHPVYTEALTQLCIQINQIKLNNQSKDTLENNSSPISIYSFKKMKDRGNLWLNRPNFEVGQLIFIFGHFGIVESITGGIPTCYLSNGEYLDLDYGAYGEFSVAMVEIKNADTANYKLMKERIMRLHELQEEERVRATYKHR